MKRTCSLILCLCMLLSVALFFGCNKQGDASAEPLFRGLESGEMFLSGYIGPRPSYIRNGEVVWEPYEDGAVFQELKDAGLNYMIDELNFVESNEYARKALEHSEKVGLMYFMAAYDVMRVSNQTMGTDEEIKAKLQELYQYDSFGGLFLIDEPSATSYPFIKECIDKLNQIESELGYTDLNPHINLLPPISGAERLSGVSGEPMDWADYIRGLSDTGIKYLSFDMYPIYGLFTKNVLPSWFTALGTMNQVALEEGKPWMGCVQVGGGSWAYLTPEQRVTTEGELKWDVNTMLAFGAKGLIYYLTVSPPFWADKEGAEEQKNWHSLINVYGEKTEFYDYVKEINEHIRAMDHVLMNSDYKGVIVTGNTPCLHYGKDLIKSNSYKELYDVTGNALVGCFDYNGKTALFVVNNSITEEGQISLSFDHTYNFEVIQNAVSRKETGDGLALNLGIGESALVVLESRDLTMWIVTVCVVAALLGVGTAVAVVFIRKRKK